MLVFNIEGREAVQLVRLDDEFDPSYAESYASKVASYCDPASVLRWCVVDVSTVAEYGPNEIAYMLEGREDYTTDLPQTWQKIGPRQ